MTHNSILRGETPPEMKSLRCPTCGHTREFRGAPPPWTCKGTLLGRHPVVRMVVA